jgi:hypothetical protein
VSPRLGLAVLAACSSATALYALLRLVQALVMKESDPALVIYSEHAGFFWRALTAGYLGGMAGFVTWLLAPRDPERMAKVVGRVLVVAAALALLQGVAVP